MRSILVATDLSEAGNKCAAYAFSVVTEGGKIRLLHVLETKPIPNPMYAHYSPGPFPGPEERKKKKEEAREALENLSSTAARKGISVDIEVIEQEQPISVSDMICQASERFKADMICLSSHGRTGLAAVFVGSVSQDIMKKSKLPLLIYRPGK